MSRAAQEALPRWRTTEFYVYYMIITIALATLCKVTYSLSSTSHPSFENYSYLLSSGWIPGRLVDISDAQYRGFRGNLRLLLLGALAHVVLSRIVLWQTSSKRIHLWHSFTIAFALVFLTIVHGFHAIKIVWIVLINYTIAKTLGKSRWNPVATWIFNFGLLFLIHWTAGLSFLDRPGWYAGFMRWNLSFNITILRLISFNLDYYWSFADEHRELIRHGSCREGGIPPYCCARMRSVLPRPMSEYSLLAYMAYILYTPLYFAGPILSFNDFIAQRHAQSHTLTVKIVCVYIVRLAAVFLLMELMMHFFYVVAISKANGTMKGLSPIELFMIGFVSLKFIWLKLLIIWRLFRAWAMVDGIEAPENMTRCMTNNYSPIEFWKHWHASFNKWNVRYIYLPLGGSRTRLWNMWVVFSFVAVWHDIELKLLTWGWLICLFLLPEMIAKYLFSKYTSEWWYRHIAAIGAIFNIAAMMTANLVGFSLGVEGMQQLLQGLVRPYGWIFPMGLFVSFFALAQVQFEVRSNEEKRKTFMTNKEYISLSTIQHHTRSE